MGCPVCCPSVMYNRDKIKNLVFNPHYSINMDWAMWLYLASLKGSFTYVDAPLIVHRIYSDSATSAGLKNKKRQKEDLEIFRHTWPSWFAGIMSKLYSMSYFSNRI